MATTKLWTIDDLERSGLPEGRWELIDGELVEMTPSGERASRIGGRALRRIGDHAEPRGLGEVFGADGGFVLFPGRDLVRVADAAFVRADRLPAEEDQLGFLRLAPDLVVEVVSPFDRPGEVAAKAAMWIEAGVRLVWVVLPESRSVTIYRPGTDPVEVGNDGVLEGGEVLPDFRLAIADLFA